MANFEPRGPDRGRGPAWAIPSAAGTALVLAVIVLVGGFMTYNACKIEVAQGEQAVLIRKVGNNLEPGMEIAPAYAEENGHYKGVQPVVLTEGRYFYNPYFWDWEISKQFMVPEGKAAVRISLVGDELPEGRVLAEPGQKGIMPGVIEAGVRVSYNPYMIDFQIVDAIDVPPGSRGVVTLMAGEEPKDSNVVLVGTGERGVQQDTLPPGKYYINPFEQRISVVDCRTKRFGLNENEEISFLSADGFSITLDGVVTFRVMEDKAAEVYVLYNEDYNGDAVEEEIITKIITPESRSICRVNGSKLTGVQFISGDDRGLFQENLEKSLTSRCAVQGIEILGVSITSIRPPQQIAGPVRRREVAKQQLSQFLQEKLQQESEAQLRVQTLLADQKAKLVEADQTVVEQLTKAEQDQTVALTVAEQKRSVTRTQLEAAKDRASALVAEAEAGAEVIRFQNRADLAGLATRVDAFGGDGSSLAQNLMIGKLAPAYRSILSNSEGPLMDLFGQFTVGSAEGALSTWGRPAPTVSAPSAAAPTESSDPQVATEPSAETSELPENPFATRTAEARP